MLCERATDQLILWAVLFISPELHLLNSRFVVRFVGGQVWEVLFPVIDETFEILFGLGD